MDSEVWDWAGGLEAWRGSGVVVWRFLEKRALGERQKQCWFNVVNAALLNLNSSAMFFFSILLEDKVSSESKGVGVLSSSSAEGRHHVGEESDRVLSLQQPKLVRSSSHTTASPDVNPTNNKEMKDNYVNSTKVENAEERGWVVAARSSWGGACNSTK